MKLSDLVFVAAVSASPAAISRRQAVNGNNTLTINDISVIQRYWGQATRNAERIQL